MRILFALPFAILLASCDDTPGSLSGQRAGGQAAEAYCACLADPANLPAVTSAAGAVPDPTGRTAAAANKANLTGAEKLFERCTTATEGRFKELMGRVPRHVDQAFRFSNEFHRRARQCEDKLRSRIP